MQDDLQLTEKATAAPLPPERSGRNSVTGGMQMIKFVVPWFRDAIALPPYLPEDNYYSFGLFRQRDAILMSTPKHEAQWASAITIAIAQLSSMSWEIASSVDIRQKRARASA
jgi:hypothetical protein